MLSSAELYLYTMAEQHGREIRAEVITAASEAAETSANSSSVETFHGLQIPAPTSSQHHVQELIQTYEKKTTMAKQQGSKIKVKLSTAASEAAETSANSSAVETFRDLHQTSAPTSSAGHHIKELIQKYEQKTTMAKQQGSKIKVKLSTAASEAAETSAVETFNDLQTPEPTSSEHHADEELIEKYEEENTSLKQSNQTLQKQYDELKIELEKLAAQLVENNCKIEEKQIQNLDLKLQVQNLEMHLKEQQNLFENLYLLYNESIDQLFEMIQREEESVKKDKENEKLTQNQDSEIAALKEQISQVTSQLATLEEDNNQKKQEIQIREDGLMAREQALLSAETSCNLKLSQCEEVLNNMEQVQSRINSMHAENKELRIQVAKKRGGLASISQDDMSLLRERRVGDLWTKYNQQLNSLCKQLVDAHVKIAKLSGQTLNKATAVKKTLHQPTAATTSRNVSSSQTRFGNKENDDFQTPLYKK